MNPKASVSPKKVFWTLLVLHAILALFMFLTPTGEGTFLGFTYKFPSAQKVFYPDTSATVDIDSIIDGLETIDTSLEVLDLDTAEIQEEKVEADKSIEYPEGEETELDNFFAALAQTKKRKGVIRILHFGDSQLEGDRISSYLRNRMQLRFGGYGPGWVQPKEPSAGMRNTARVTQSGDWKKYAIYGNLKKHPQRIYGPGGASFTYAGTYSTKIGEDTLYTEIPILKRDTLFSETDTTYLVDTLGWAPDTVYKGIYEKRTLESSYIKFAARGPYPRVRKVKTAHLYYAADTTTQLWVSQGKSEKQLELTPKNKIGKLEIPYQYGQKQLTLNFSGMPSPTVLGLTLDGDSGVAVDNFPMRGSSGMGYGTVNAHALSQLLTQMETRLVVMQFGVNVIPNPRKNYGWYKRMFAAQLQAIKKACPEADILVIGPSDMSRKVGDEFKSYPNVTLIRDAMKAAAFENGCAFWDLYRAMGGENSMVSWVNAKPSLAAKDYTHFNARGAQFVGEMLYKSLMAEYYRYQLRMQKEKS